MPAGREIYGWLPIHLCVLFECENLDQNCVKVTKVTKSEVYIADLYKENMDLHSSICHHICLPRKITNEKCQNWYRWKLISPKNNLELFFSIIKLVFRGKHEFYLFYYSAIFKDRVPRDFVEHWNDVIVVKKHVFLHFIEKYVRLKLRKES